MLEHLGGSSIGEVPGVLPRLAVGLHHTVDELPTALLPGWCVECATEVFRGDDGRGIDAPEVWELNAFLLEDDLAGLPVGLHHIAAFPDHLVIGMTVRGENPLNTQPGGLRLRAVVVRSPIRRTGGFGHFCLSVSLLLEGLALTFAR